MLRIVVTLLVAALLAPTAAAAESTLGERYRDAIKDPADSALRHALDLAPDAYRALSEGVRCGVFRASPSAPERSLECLLTGLSEALASTSEHLIAIVDSPGRVVDGL